MKIKRASYPGQFVCPEAQCKFTNVTEKKLASHVLLEHGNTTHVHKAQEDIQRIKLEKQKKKKDQENNKEKGAEEKKDARHKKEIEDMKKTIKRMKEEADSQAEAQRLQEHENKTSREAIKNEVIKDEGKSDTESEKENEENPEENKTPAKKPKKKKRKKDKKDSEENDKRRHPKKKKKKKDKGSDSSSSSSSSDSDGDKDEEGRSAKGHKNKQTIQPLIFDWNNYIKPTCLIDNPSKEMAYFVQKQALTRGDIGNPNRAYGDKKFKPIV